MPLSITASQERRLGLFKLVMMIVISVDSIRSIPLAAQYGPSLLTLYLIAGLAFLLPIISLASRFASQYPQTGGSYLWIEAAFGKKIGFLSVWLQWVVQIIWYPTIFAFIASTFASLIHPAWETNPIFILSISLFSFWLMTFMSSYGITANSWISSIGAIVGTLLPMILIILLALFWILSGQESASSFKLASFIPNQAAWSNAAFFSNILFSLVGIEMATVHAGNVKMPQKTYRKAMISAGLIILGSLSMSSLALCVVIPSHQIGLLNGLMQAFQIFLAKAHLSILLPVIGIAIILGGLGIAFAWISGLARSLHIACRNSGVFKCLHRLNQYGMPSRILILQGCIYSLLIALFLLFQNVNSAYWILSVLSAQFALLYYLILFCAAIKLYRRSNPHPFHSYKTACIEVFMPFLGFSVSFLGILVGLIPPENLSGYTTLGYEGLIASGLIAFLIPMLFLIKKI